MELVWQWSYISAKNIDVNLSMNRDDCYEKSAQRTSERYLQIFLLTNYFEIEY